MILMSRPSDSIIMINYTSWEGRGNNLRLSLERKSGRFLHGSYVHTGCLSQTNQNIRILLQVSHFLSLLSGKGETFMELRVRSDCIFGRYGSRTMNTNTNKWFLLERDFASVRLEFEFGKKVFMKFTNTLKSVRVCSRSSRTVRE